MDLRLPYETASLYFSRKADHLEIYMSPTEGETWHLRSDQARATTGPLEVDLFKKLRIPPHEGLHIPLPAVEVDEYAKPYSDATIAQATWPLKNKVPGDRTSNIRILHEEYGVRDLTLTFEGEAASSGLVSLFRNSRVEPKVSLVNGKKRDLESPEASVSYRDCDSNHYECKTLPLVVHFPPGTGFQTITVTLTW